MTTSAARNRRFPRVEDERLIEVGFFTPGDPVGRIGGQLIVAEPPGSRHVIAIRLAEQAFRAAFGSGRDVRTQGPSGVPHVDTDASAHVELVFALAREFDRDIDFHLDTFDEARDLSIGHVAALTVKHGWQGRVCAGHMTALGALEPAELAPLAAMIRDAGISVLALPATDLSLTGGGDTRNPSNGWPATWYPSLASPSPWASQIGLRRSRGPRSMVSGRTSPYRKPIPRGLESL